MTFYQRSSISVLLLLLPLYLQAQSKSTVAVLDFQPRGISQLEAQSLTDRFATSVGNTGEVILVERNAMDEILNEQGFQQSGCTTSECAVEVGKLLGVQFMINGSIGLVGRTYTVDAKMFSVESGASIRNKSVTYQGEIDGLLIEMSVLAWEILGLEPPNYLIRQRSQGIGSLIDKPKTVTGAVTRSLLIPGGGQFYLGKKISGTLFLTSEVLAIGLAYYGYTDYQNQYQTYTDEMDLYHKATDPQSIATHRGKAKDAERMMTTSKQLFLGSAAAAGGIWIFNILHSLRAGKTYTALGESGFRLSMKSYHELSWPGLELSYALD